MSNRPDCLGSSWTHHDFVSVLRKERSGEGSVRVCVFCRVLEVATFHRDTGEVVFIAYYKPM